MVQAIVQLLTANAHEAVREEPVGRQQSCGVVCWLLASRGAEAQSCQKGTAMVSLTFLPCWIGWATYDMVIVDVARNSGTGPSYIGDRRTWGPRK
jgi:hypothetical protein